MKIKNKIIVALLIVAVCAPALIYAGQIKFVQRGEVYLRAKQLDWNTYYFEPRVNEIEESDVNYVWEFSDGQKFEGRDLIRTFEAGEYLVTLTAVDFFGRQYMQSAKLKIKYISLNNIWFWASLYLIILLLIVYYAFARLIFWANERKIRKEAKIFVDQLEDMDFWSNLVKAIKKS